MAWIYHWLDGVTVLIGDNLLTQQGTKVKFLFFFWSLKRNSWDEILFFDRHQKIDHRTENPLGFTLLDFTIEAGNALKIITFDFPDTKVNSIFGAVLITKTLLVLIRSLK